MSPSDFDDATLMAYADGTLEPGDAQRVAEAATNPEVAARIAMFRETGARLAALGASRPSDPLPDDLARRVERTLAEARQARNVVSFPAPRPAWRPAALAASVALVVGAVGGIVAGLALRDSQPAAPSLALLDSPGVRAALDSLAAGARGSAGATAEVEIISSFLTDSGTFCREFELHRSGGESVVSVACRESGAWAARFAVVAPGSDEASYAPASALATLDAFLATIGAGPPLSPADEAARLSSVD